MVQYALNCVKPSQPFITNNLNQATFKLPGHRGNEAFEEQENGEGGVFGGERGV